MPTHDHQDLCLPCQKALPWLKNACPRCAFPLTETNDKHALCGDCLKNSPQYSRTIALFSYQFPIDHLISGLKFANKLIYCQILGNIMAETITNYYQNKPLPEIIIPIPLHVQRLKERGYNQALELAKPIAKKLQIGLDRYSFIRIKTTKAQALISAKQRKQNIKNAFLPRKTINYKYVAIIDDVVTTGNTVREFSNILIANGIQKIDIWCCARTISFS